MNKIGIKDEEFIRGSVPMTKSEVRAVTISKLKLSENSKVLDIGSGTGSISIECGFNAKEVVSIDKNKKAIDLLNENIEKFNLKNITSILGNAPKDIPNIKFDRVVIGGSGGCLEDIFNFLKTNLISGGRVVSNFITIENANECLKLFKKYNYKNLDFIQLQVSRGKFIGDLTLLEGLNPVFIISGEKNE